jgi:hypothetical protein
LHYNSAFVVRVDMARIARLVAASDECEMQGSRKVPCFQLARSSQRLSWSCGIGR